AWGRGGTFIVAVPLARAPSPTGPDPAPAAPPSPPAALGAGLFLTEATRWLPDPSQIDAVVAGRFWGQGASAGCEGPGDNQEVGDRPRVLVADDNADMRQHLGRLLAGAHEFVGGGDGRAALAAARDRPSDLVLADVMMPELDGFGLLRELRADPRTRTVPVVLLSARAGEESRVEGLAAGADDYLVKPFSARELLARVGA